MEISSLGFRTHLMVLSLGGSVVTDRGDYVVVRTPANPTYYWGNFLLFGGPGDVDERLAVFATEFPDAGHVAWGIDTLDGSAGDEEALKAAGFSIGRDTVMTATAVREPARPNHDVELRPMTGDDDWSQQVDLRQATFEDTDGGGAAYRVFLERLVASERTLTEQGDAVWFGAFDGGRLVSSLGLASDGGELARFQAVGTHPDSRGRGIASTLVHHASRYGFDTLGARTLVMVADPEYLAIRLYRAVGFADTETKVEFTRSPS